jgi:hypothetical protein
MVMGLVVEGAYNNASNTPACTGGLGETELSLFIGTIHNLIK